MKRILLTLLGLAMLLGAAQLAVEYYEFSHPALIPQTVPDAFIATTLIHSPHNDYRSEAFDATVYFRLVAGKLSMRFTGLVEREILFPPEMLPELIRILEAYRDTQRLALSQRLALERDLGSVRYIDEQGSISPILFQFSSSLSDGYVFRGVRPGIYMSLPFSLEQSSSEPSRLYLRENAVERLDSLIRAIRQRLTPSGVIRA